MSVRTRRQKNRLVPLEIKACGPDDPTSEEVKERESSQTPTEKRCALIVQKHKERFWPRVYVSTTSQRVEVAREAIAYLKAHECAITHDWTEDFEPDCTFSDGHLAKRAEADIKGCTSANFVVVIMAKEMGTAMTGSAVEIGAALARDVQVIIVEYETSLDHFFKNHPRMIKARSLEMALDLIRWGHRV